jgi:methylenetetrahydrofolate dehydrogenase (NADP+)/methenyltetrahydrofolate cyclohydrolase
MGRLFYNDGLVAPCTPMAAVELLRRTCREMDLPLAGREAVVVGHSEIVGKPIAAMLLASRRNAPTVTVCHVATRELAEHTRRAEVLLVAAGVAQAKWMGYCRAREAGFHPERPDLRPLVRGEMVREGAVVIDVAINRVPERLDAEGRPVASPEDAAEMVTVGDVDFPAAVKKAGAITPVPGGVGPVTVAMLLRNTIALARRQAGLPPLHEALD